METTLPTGQESNQPTGMEIAVIGMAGRFPGAAGIHQFWENLKNGVEGISFFSDEELKEARVDAALVESPHYVKANGILQEPGCFDAAFFGYTPVEADIMDPQMRVFHECVYQALENAGYPPAVAGGSGSSYDGLIGLYGGASPNVNWEALNLLNAQNSQLGLFAAGQLSNKDYLTARVAYKLDLKGPNITLNTACSTSLVSVHMAVQGLLSGDCDIAAAGGVSITMDRKQGYIYQEGMILSPDGHCRAFDAQAGGTVVGNGVAVVALKRLDDALEDGDFIYAIIKGTALNSDGIGKTGFTAPSVEGQAAVISNAYESADVSPETIGYIEAHGTGTALGDPVEIEGLKLAFNSSRKDFCRIGSVKTNIGHLDAAAGAAGLIKAVLALHHRLIPPSLHFTQPNPAIDFENSPFRVNTELTPWPQSEYPRRAGVSSFGIGGTNVHVVLEEAPQREETDRAAHSGSQYQILPLSAKTGSALQATAAKLGGYLEANQRLSIHQIADTLQHGRNAFAHRDVVVSSSIPEAASTLSQIASQPSSAVAAGTPKKPVFLFTGQGSQYVNMGRELYKKEPLFREEMNCCFAILNSLTGTDFKTLLYPIKSEAPNGSENTKHSSSPKAVHIGGPGGAAPWPAGRPPGGPPEANTQVAEINRTENAQPLLFVIHYALAKLLISWGIQPHIMMGHSIGEYAAAFFARVFSLEDVLAVVVRRGQLMQQMPEGDMLSVPLPEKELAPFLPAADCPESEQISVAAVNSANRCVLSGPAPAIASLTEKLKAKGIGSRKLHTSHAFHSQMMAPAAEQFRAMLETISMNPPQTPFISNITGKPIESHEAVSPDYWARHLLSTVRFADGLNEIAKEDNRLLIEVGPGETLCTFARQQSPKTPAVNLLRHPGQDVADHLFLLTKIGQIWKHGAAVRWEALTGRETIARIPLPGYSFDRTPFRAGGDIFDIVANMPTLAEALQGQKGDLTPTAGTADSSAANEVSRPLEPTKLNLQARPTLSTPYVAPESETEKRLAQLEQQFFGYASIGLNDDFFELGGDSLKAMSLTTKIHKAFQVKFPLEEVFRGRTIKEFALYIESATPHQFRPISPAAVKDDYPLSAAQRRLYFIQQLTPQSTAYNLPEILCLDETPDIEQIKETLQALVLRHESLRTSFQTKDEQPIQVIHDTVDFQIHHYHEDEPPMGFDTSETRNEKGAASFVQPFDLSRAPLFRVGLLETPRQSFLLVDMHHIISDGMSSEILARDFMLLYRGDQLPSLPLQYKDYAVWQDESEREENHPLRAQERYWLDLFAGEIPQLDFPTDFDRPAIKDFCGSHLRFHLDTDLTARVKELADQTGTTLYMVLLAMYYVLLLKYTGQEEIVVGTPVSGRTHADLENIIGMFVNMLPMKNQPRPALTFLQFLEEVKSNTMAAYKNQDYQFDALVIQLGLQGDRSRNPLFDTAFKLYNITGEAVAPAADNADNHKKQIEMAPLEFESGISLFDFMLGAVEVDGTIFMTLEFSTQLFKPSTMEKMADRYLEVVDQTTENPSIKLKDISVIRELMSPIPSIPDNEGDFDFKLKKKHNEEVTTE